jgi:hypothetical protein
MSLDYPFYEKLRRRAHPAAKWWRLGDVLYYLGLLPAIILILPATSSLSQLRAEREAGVVTWRAWSLAIWIVCLGLFAIGVLLKRKSYAMAAKDGIDSIPD